MEDIEYGCLGTGESNTDYILDEGVADGLPDLYEQDDIRYEYNQGNQSWSKKSCTIFQAIGAVSDLNNVEVSLDEIKEVDDSSYSKGRVKGAGWDVKSAVDHVCKRWNEKHPDMQVAYYKISMDNDELIEKVISKKYNICTGFYGNVKRQNDYYYDAILNGTTFGTATFGHAINVIKDSTKGRAIKDNYKGRTGKNNIDTNIYGLEHLCSEIKPFHNCGYVITKVKENNLAELKKQEEMKTIVNLSIQLNQKLWNLSSDSVYKENLHNFNEIQRKKQKTIEEIIKKLS